MAGEKSKRKWEVSVDWSGYSRGYSTFIVEADSKEAAMANYYMGECAEREVVRDDTDMEASDAEEIVDGKQ